MGGAVSTGADNDDLVDNLVDGDYLKNADVIRIFRVVDRGLYFLPDARQQAYRDSAWRDGQIHLSAPCIYAEVMESLRLGRGMSFLNIGSGTGYLSTMVGLVLGAHGTNHGLELFESNVKYATERLQQFLLTSAALRYFDFAQPKFVVGNMMNLGEECFGRYDRIYVGAACDDEEKHKFLARFLRVGGIMVVPINDHLVRVVRKSVDEFERDNLMACSFANLIYPNGGDTETVILPGYSMPSLKQICRNTVVSALRMRILQDQPALYMARSHHKHIEPRRRIHRVIFPLLIAQDDGEEGEGPHIVLGNPIHSSDNVDISLFDDEHPPATANQVIQTDEAPGSSAKHDDEDHRGSEESDPSVASARSPSSSSNVKDESSHSVRESSEQKTAGNENDTLSSDSDEEEDDDGEPTDPCGSGPSSGFSANTRRLFRKRRLSARTNSESQTAEPTSEGPKRRSLFDRFFQSDIRSVTVNGNSAGLTATAEINAGPAHGGSSTQRQRRPDTPGRIRRLSPPEEVEGQPDRSEDGDETGARLAAANPPAPETTSLPAAELMDVLMSTSVSSLPIPPSFQRFLNFNRPLRKTGSGK